MKYALKVNGLTQEEAANKLGITRQKLSMWLQLDSISNSVIQNINDALNINLRSNAYELSVENPGSFDLKMYRMRKRLSQKEFAEALGITQGYLSELESFKKEISDSIKYKIIELYGEDISNNSLVQEQISKYESPVGAIPFYEVDVSASADIQMFLDKHEIATKYVIPGFEDCDFAVPVFGHSMYPTYENGCIIMCKKIEDKQLIVFGEAYLIITKDFRMVKRIQKSEIIGNVLACSDNEEERTKSGRKKYEAVELPIDKILHLYLVKGVIKRNQL